jgi:hypothetical protein
MPLLLAARRGTRRRTALSAAALEKLAPMTERKSGYTDGGEWERENSISKGGGVTNRQ